MKKELIQIFSKSTLYVQGYKDSNLEMTESESVALPFGDSPLLHNGFPVSESHYKTPPWNLSTTRCIFFI